MRKNLSRLLPFLVAGCLLASAAACQSDDHAHGPGTHTHDGEAAHEHGPDTHTHDADTAGTYVDTTGAFFDAEPADHEHGPETHTHD